MPAYAHRQRMTRPRERAFALAAVVLIQAGFALVLLSGFRVNVARSKDVVQRLVDITLPQPPPPPVVEVKPRPTRNHRAAAAPKAAPEKLGGSRGPRPAHAPPSVTPVVAVVPKAAPSGGGTGTGPAMGSGAGGGTGGNGYDGDEGGS